MGRHLTWYIISSKMEHDKTKQICFDLEYEPESHEIDEKIFNIVNPDIKEINYVDYPTNADRRKAYHERQKEISECGKYTYNDNRKNQWCQTCFTYFKGIYYNSIDSIDVLHSYSNPIWRSHWNVKDLYMGSSTTGFIRRFSTERQYREIFENDVNIAFRTIEDLGLPISTSDIEAKEETLKVLNFLKKYTGMNDVRIIISDEF